MYITRLDAHHKLLIALVAALIVFALTSGNISLKTQLIVTWITFALIMLSLYWSTILTVHPLDMKKVARTQDSNRTLIFIFVLAAAVASLFVVVLLLSSTKELSGVELSMQVILSVSAVTCSWAMVHTIFAFRYAHLYYELAEPESKSKAEIKSKEEQKSKAELKPEQELEPKYIEGLEFPKELKPDYLDFAYFSFVIGMTFQVSDVEISSKRIRRLALMHGLVAFAFNTIIVALSINIISGLISK